jgi:hypothetical protein
MEFWGFENGFGFGGSKGFFKFDPIPKNAQPMVVSTSPVVTNAGVKVPQLIVSNQTSTFANATSVDPTKAAVSDIVAAIFKNLPQGSLEANVSSAVIAETVEVAKNVIATAKSEFKAASVIVEKAESEKSGSVVIDRFVSRQDLSSERFFHVASFAAAEDLPMLDHLLTAASTSEELRSLPAIIANFLLLPSADRAKIRESVVRTSESVAEKTVKNETVEKTQQLQKTEENTASRPLISEKNRQDIEVSSEQKVIVVFAEAVQAAAQKAGIVAVEKTEPASSSSAPKTLVRFGSQVLTKFAASVPVEQKTEVATFFNILTKGNERPRSAMSITALEQGTIERFVVRAFSNPVSAKAAVGILQAWNHRHWKIRLTVVNVLAHLAFNGRSEKSLSSLISERLMIAYLKVLARDKQSVQVKAEAIKVLLDLYSGGKKSDQEMQQLFEEIELIGSLKKLLKGRDSQGVLAGLALLSKVWERLNASQKQSFMPLVMHIAENGRTEAAVEEAVTFLVLHDREITNKVDMLKGDLLDHSWVANRRQYRDGRVHYAGTVAA